MLLVGLTGGIGSGKSTVAEMFRSRGAVVFDADELARLAVAPGSPAVARVAERLGRDVLAEDGSLDRAAVAARVFEDENARRDLEAIVHPEVFRLLMEGIQRYRDSDAVVVFDAPLIVETGFHRACDAVVLVTAPVEERVARLVEQRRMLEEDARRRVAAQVTDDQREPLAHHVLRNTGSMQDLEHRVDELFDELRRRAGAGSSS